MNRTFINLLRRNFLKHRYLHFFNLIGITFGLVCFGLVIIYVNHEYSFDSFHFDVENTYRIEGKTNSDFMLSNIDREYGKELNSGKYSQLIGLIQVSPLSNVFFGYGDKRFGENKILRVKPGSKFFDVFNFKFLAGNQEGVLTDPYALVITETTAKKYFGDENALGKVINYDSLLLTVKGVIEDSPSNTHFDFDLIYTLPRSEDEHFHAYTYLQLTGGTSPKSVEDLILGLRDDLNEFHKLTKVKLIRINDIYFESQAGFGNSGGGDKTQLIAFIITGSLILLIALLNYINLSLAIYSAKRFEVGIRKILGETKLQFLYSMISEALLVAILSLTLALIGIEFALPIFSDFLILDFDNKFLTSPLYLLSAALFIILINLITAAYPVRILSQANVSRLVKSKKPMNDRQGLKFWKFLIFTQFILFFTLSISAWFVNQQVRYINNKDLGFSTSGVIKIRNAFFLGDVENYQLLKEKLLTHSQIEKVTHGAVIGDAMAPLAYRPEGHDQVYENLLSFGVGEDYFDLMNIEILEGDIRKTMLEAESGKVVSLVNQSLINQFNWNDAPLGKSLILRPDTENELHRTISSVFNDIHFFSLKEKISPHIISLRKDPTNININILVKTNPENLSIVYKIIEDEWNAMLRDRPIDYTLVDDEISSMYHQEEMVGNLTLMFSVLAILLSLGGLIVFVVHITRQRSKEIALRQVLGASLLQIVMVLNRKTFGLILLAAILGSSLSYFLINKWLMNYANTINVNPIAFLIATIAGFGIVLIVIFSQSINSASINPVKALSQDN